jgi:ABC-type lipoprotein export system ATPase subunit
MSRAAERPPRHALAPWRRVGADLACRQAQPDQRLGERHRGGQQQRVAIARAMAHRPLLLLADEPTAEVDSKIAFKIMKLFQDLVREQSVTIVMTTHDPEVMDMADIVFSLEDGKIEEVQSKFEDVESV